MMEVMLSESEKLLQQAAREYLERRCPLSRCRAMECDAKGLSPEIWNQMAELGWLEVPVAREQRSEGRDFFGLTLVVEQMGRVLLTEPFIPTVVSALAILKFGDSSQRNHLLPQVARGNLVLTHALLEPGVDLNEKSIRSYGKPNEQDFLLFGNKSFVPELQVAQRFLCPVRTPEGITVFILDSQTQGITSQLIPTMASDRQWEIELNGVRATRHDILGGGGRGWPVVKAMIQYGTCLSSAYAVGAAERALELTKDYAKKRHQFGKPIGSFQALAHKIADLVVLVDGARLIVYEAAWKLSKGSHAEFEISSAKNWAAEAFHRVTEEGMRIHASMGYAMECDIQLFYRRAAAFRVLWGEPSYHREKVAQLMGI